VRKIVPRERLLEVEPGSGWEPLCKFLNKRIPDQLFPHVNEAAARDRFAQKILKKAATAWTGIFVAIGLIVFLFLRFFKL
jgi:hypothetical protein